ncbi:MULTISPECIES: ABC transporter ATP-binding protein [unclassified Streptosporangium]|uniref:ABC transporter ATP-binding protein n=1 Tax=unclassified Streptosporangium TaxID=2632669 RepID=UPI0033B257D2
MLEISDIQVSYGKVEAVRGVSLLVKPGKVTLVLGANGAGKSTTLKAIAGLEKPHAGTIRLDGRDITGLPPHKIVRRGIALVPEGRRVFSPLMIHENLRMGAYVAPRNSYGETLAKVYEMFPILKERSHSAAGLLSGGEQQMLAFGRALMSQPKVMLMDEPSMGLAPAIVDSILAKVRTMADSGIGILMVEQNAEAGLEVADDVVAIARGEVVFTGPAASARDNAAVLRAFLGEAALVGHGD